MIAKGKGPQICGHNLVCIEDKARHICLRTHDPAHCRLWHRLHGDPPKAHVAQPAAPSGPWLKVAICEESGRNDPTYGYLGILPSTWVYFGGTKYAPLAGGATWQEQVAIAERVQSDVPDQNGCDPGGW